MLQEIFNILAISLNVLKHNYFDDLNKFIFRFVFS